MGAYLSAPVRDKLSDDKSTEQLRYGASSMQGWRVAQEDAHNCCPDFDPETGSSFFAVYDGHGGAEVAQYTAMHLPDYLKTVKAYKEGNLSQSLQDAFLGFDATLTQEQIVQELKELAGVNPDDEDEEEKENEVADLCEEATMPLEEVLEKYGAPGSGKGLRALRKKENIQSPMIRPKKDGPGLGPDTENSTNDSAEDSLKTKLENKLVNGHSDNENNENIEKEKAKLTDTPNEVPISMEEKSIEHKSNIGESVDKESSTKSEEKAGGGDGAGSTEAVKEEPSSGSKGSGEGDAGSSSSTCENEVSQSAGGSAGGSGSSTTEDPVPGSSSGRVRKPRQNVIPGEDEDESSFSEDEDDDLEEDWGSDSEDDEDLEGMPGSDDEDDEDGEGSEEEEECEEIMTGGEEPGADSGCTAVVALLRGRDLYVANAGDSRCVVSRGGKAIDMSVDHKPEDELEQARIEKAGGRVTNDGRVNGGLNLSRAIGDHCYKKNEELPAQEQMITALPDVRSMALEEADDFMVLACDGIWNVMSSQDVVNFVSERLKAGVDKLSTICEEMFEFCLAPDTTGDGTGCDNMTCIIVTLDKLSGSIQSGSSKRRASNGVDCAETSDVKKAKEDN